MNYVVRNFVRIILSIEDLINHFIYANKRFPFLEFKYLTHENDFTSFFVREFFSNDSFGLSFRSHNVSMISLLNKR